MIGNRGSTRSARVVRYREGDRERIRDTLVVEEPLEIRLSWVDPDGRRATEPLAVTMRTPGDDFELVAGFLHGEGVVSEAADVLELTYCRGDHSQEYNTVEARLRPGVAFDLERTRRNFYATSSCGVCGKASLDAVTTLGCRTLPEGFTVDPTLLPELPDLLRDRQDAFERTGGLHAAGLFGADGTCLGVREDVGRHNAVDKVLGAAFLERRLPASEAVLVVSGRASFELVQKAVMAGVPMLVAVGAPSTLAVDLARRFGQTLVGFARDGGCNVYTGEERVA
ncbi:MAG: formate dehydrogenase accessory sulfurtransferase FdhD [Gemmatimonadota bacterium]